MKSDTITHRGITYVITIDLTGHILSVSSTRGLLDPNNLPNEVYEQLQNDISRDRSSNEEDD